MMRLSLVLAAADNLTSFPVFFSFTFLTFLTHQNQS